MVSFVRYLGKNLECLKRRSNEQSGVYELAIGVNDTAEQLIQIRIRDVMWIRGGTMPPTRQVGRLARPAGVDALGGLEHGFSPLTEVRLDDGFNAAMWTASRASIHARHLIMGPVPLARLHRQQREAPANAQLLPAFTDLRQLSLACDTDDRAAAAARFVVTSIGAGITTLTIDDEILDDEGFCEDLRAHASLRNLDVGNFNDESGGLMTLLAASHRLHRLNGLVLDHDDLYDAFHLLQPYAELTELSVSIMMRGTQDAVHLRNFLVRLHDCIPRITAAGGRHRLDISVWSGTTVGVGDQEAVEDAVFSVFPQRDYRNVAVTL